MALFAGWVTSATSSSFHYPEVLLSILCFLIIFHLNRRRRKGFPTNWPIVGMLPALLLNIKNLQDYATYILETFGCTFLFKGPWYAGMDFLVTCDPADINHIYSSNFTNYPKGEEYAEVFDILGNGIFNSENESWKVQRKLSHRLLMDQRFQSFVEETSYRKVRRAMVPLLDHAVENELVLDLQDIFLRFTFDVASILNIGVDPGCLSPTLPVVPFAKAINDAEEVLFYRHVVPHIWWKTMRWLGIGKERKMAKAWETIDKFIGEQISKRKEEMKQNKNEELGKTKPDILSSCLNLDSSWYNYNNNNNKYVIDLRSDNFLRDTVLNFMIAGRDSSASGITWFFWLVTQNPHVETKILEELRASSSNYDEEGFIIIKDLNSLVYLHAAFCESLRLYPPVPYNHKNVVKPEILPSGHEATPEVKILVSHYAMARIEGIWGKDCREFRPERWISDKGTIRLEPTYKFATFSSGPRNCVGKNMSFALMKSVAVTLLAKYKIEAVEGHEVVPKTSIILHMMNGMKVRVKKRLILENRFLL